MRKKGNRASRPSAAGRAAGGEGMAAASASGTLVGDSGMGQGMGQAAITLEKVELSSPDDLSVIPSPWVRMIDDWCMPGGGGAADHGDSVHDMIVGEDMDVFAAGDMASFSSHATDAEGAFGGHHDGMSYLADTLSASFADFEGTAMTDSQVGSPLADCRMAALMSSVEATPTAPGPKGELSFLTFGEDALHSSQAQQHPLGFARSFSYTPGLSSHAHSANDCDARSVSGSGAAGDSFMAAGSCDTLFSHADLFLGADFANAGAATAADGKSPPSMYPGFSSTADTPSPLGVAGIAAAGPASAEPHTMARHMSVDNSTPLHAPQRHLPWAAASFITDDTCSMYDTASESNLEIYGRQASMPLAIPNAAAVSAAETSGRPRDMDFMFRPSSCPPAPFLPLPQAATGQSTVGGSQAAAASLQWSKDPASATAPKLESKPEGLQAHLHQMQVLAFQRQMQQQQQHHLENEVRKSISPVTWGPMAPHVGVGSVFGTSAPARPGMFDSLKRKAPRRKRRGSTASADNAMSSMHGIAEAIGHPQSRLAPAGPGAAVSAGLGVPMQRSRSYTAGRTKSVPAASVSMPALGMPLPMAAPKPAATMATSVNTAPPLPASANPNMYSCPWATCKRSLPQLDLLKEHIEAAHGKEFYQGLIVRGGGDPETMGVNDGSETKFLAAALRNRKRIILLKAF